MALQHALVERRTVDDVHEVELRAGRARQRAADCTARSDSGVKLVPTHEALEILHGRRMYHASAACQRLGSPPSPGDVLTVNVRR